MESSPGKPKLAMHWYRLESSSSDSAIGEYVERKKQMVDSKQMQPDSKCTMVRCRVKMLKRIPASGTWRVAWLKHKTTTKAPAHA